MLSSALPIKKPESFGRVQLPDDPYVVSQSFNAGSKGKSPFGTAGTMQNFLVATCDVVEAYEGERGCLGNVVVPAAEVPEGYFIPADNLKGSKSEERVDKRTGFKYRYSEGSMAFPDLLTNPSRTILTGEGGAGASRFKHVVEIDGRYRRLVPDELDRLQGFPKGWTDTGMTDAQRAFCMGNRIGQELARRLREEQG